MCIVHTYLLLHACTTEGGWVRVGGWWVVGGGGGGGGGGGLLVFVYENLPSPRPQMTVL